MKGLDTPVLLQILHGTSAAQSLLRSLRGEELATSEINMFELGQLATHAPRSARALRQKAVAALRRRITVVPISGKAVDEGLRSSGGHGAPSGYDALAWGAMVAAGCQEWITTRSFVPPRSPPGMKVRIL